MTTTTDLHYLSLHELSARIRAKEVSPVDATEALLQRIERLNPKLNAYLTVMADAALAEARAAQDEIAAGSYRGALHGVPVAVKDLCQTKGVRTTGGSKILDAWLPDEDAAVVERLREAGAVLLGKLHLHEWAFGATGWNDHYGPARNPWNTDYIPGGSSSGAGAGVAAGLCYAAIGSDTGGSVRIPSSLCGVAGIKPTYGRVSVHGVIPLSWSLDHLGPLARTARDCALVLESTSGHDPRDPHSADAPVERWSEGLDLGVRRLRIGVVREAFAQAQDEVAAAVRKAIETLAGLGAEVREVGVPLDAYWGPTSVVLLAEAAAYHKANFESRPDDFGPNVRGRVAGGFDIKAVDYVQAYRTMQDVRRTCNETLLSEVDLLVMPSTVQPAAKIDDVQKDDPTLGLTLLTAPFDLTGQPAMSVPCGFTSGGLPIGLQLVGRRFDEATVLRAAHAFESAAGVSSARPPVD